MAKQSDGPAMIVLPSWQEIENYGKPEEDPEHDPLSVLLARTDTRIGRAITDAVMGAAEKSK